MSKLDELKQSVRSGHELPYGKDIALTFQPQSSSDFHQHSEFDEVFRRWTQGDSNRGLDFVRIWSLALNCKNALQRNDGSVAELGVYQGQGAALLALYAEQFSRKIYLCDTFGGFPEQQLELEENAGDGVRAAFKDVDLESARRVVGNYPGIDWVVGSFPGSVTPAMRDDKFAFVSIDCDIYEPILQGLRFFWPRMQQGGVVFVHDYSSGYWPGATKAVDEFCAETGIGGCLLPDLAGTIVLVRGRS